MNSRREPDWLLVEEALDRILAAVVPTDTEEVALLEAGGRTLSEGIVSPIDQPPWSNSAMDGFAIRAADVRGASAAAPRVLRVTESIAAGSFPTRSVGPGEAIEIMTGAPVPEGADSVVRVEHTRALGGDRIEVLEDGDAGRNIRERGEDVRQGDTVLGAGQVVRAGEVGVLAMIGRRTVPVYRRPRVGILSTGNELTEIADFEAVRAGLRIVDSNSYSLAAAARAVGCEPVRLGIARDDIESLTLRLAPIGALDALITTAGASVGEHDVVKDALERMGMRTEFWRVRIRPGSPFSFGLLERPGRPPLPVFGLPGNPVSAVVTFEILAKPALRRMQGRTLVHAQTLAVRAAERIRSPSGLVRFLRVRLENRAGEWHASLTGEQGSGILTSVARADALLVVPLDRAVLEPGDPAVAVPLTAHDAAQARRGF